MKELKNLDCLLPKTRQLLLRLIDTCDFLNDYVFVGGSALALHICHRKSEDLDFFTYADTFDLQQILDYISKFENKVIINQSSEQVDLLLDGIKVTFFNAKWPFLKPKVIEKFNLANIEALGAMKINTLFLRAKYRDYYDLYFLLKDQMLIEDLYQASSNIIPGLTFKLFASALLYIDDIEDDLIGYLEPKETISKEEIRDYFQNKLVLYNKGRLKSD
ncbi:nucleotidyltransferase AbiEii toxin of type IV toxin-antitoxin system [Allofrancisella inopinata]|uniref:Nucleotidyltransferase AbiEii toxin of type IV toxin-antitoxin system n=1 Tax=Allofrancisella inopinata TaxID=1085647 RepID=A0AAE6YJ59_9GAMM|nr:nucleotidyl transferase AbiEii/AbiGii toxin family protein [Allofrancisella inopinata]QIV95724.1 hypothetical protein E4K63_02315 [Allofrancisella inopinata]TDT67950.1 nucleotidyltransferase AbiEii toxin of type IV toxin-antitoxin system [Allofrancisella inopinata]